MKILFEKESDIGSNIFKKCKIVHHFQKLLFERSSFFNFLKLNFLWILEHCVFEGDQRATPRSLLEITREASNYGLCSSVRSNVFSWNFFSLKLVWVPDACLEYYWTVNLHCSSVIFSVLEKLTLLNQKSQIWAM